MLQRIEKARASQGLRVLAVATDGEETRSRIPDFLKRKRIDIQVLLDDEKERAGYEVNGVPALYVIDRQGWIAGVPAERLGSDEKRLGGVLDDLLEGKPPAGRTLVTIGKAPVGWGEIWKAKAESLLALTIAAPIGSAGSQVAALSGDRVERWSAAGEPLGNWKVGQGYREIAGADLDGNGTQEWILAGDWLSVLDGTGQRYWAVGGGDESNRSISILAIRGAAPKRPGDILMRDVDSIVRWNHLGSPAWQKNGLRDSLVLSGSGNTLLVQTAGRVEVLDRQGRRLSSHRSPPLVQLKGWLQGDKYFREFYGDPDPFDQRIDTGHDIDGDGISDLIVVSPPALLAYDASGTLLLRVEVNDQRYFSTAFGNLDGRPGDEIVLAIDNFGLVALGRKDPARIASPVSSRHSAR